MATVSVELECPVHDSFRVQQVAGMFDVPLAEKLKHAVKAEVPGLDEDWRIGCIVGPSGSGKSTLAREVYGRDLVGGFKWPKGASVLDAFDDSLSIKQITGTLTAVGFSSPPSWVKPYHVLSNGEKFRCDLARALLADRDVVAFDEFTSVVDRTVAQIGSAAVAKAIRKDRVRGRFVAVTCHYDVLDWLSPDWVVDMATCQLARRCLQPGERSHPPITLRVVRCTSEAWPMFAPHHYLTGTLGPGAVCYIGVAHRRPVAIAALLPALGKRGFKRISRLVVLPDWQGIGIGGALLDAVGGLTADAGYRVSITTSHPAMIARLQSSAAWRCVRVQRSGGPKSGMALSTAYKASTGRAVVAFEYVPEGDRNV